MKLLYYIFGFFTSTERNEWVSIYPPSGSASILRLILGFWFWASRQRFDPRFPQLWAHRSTIELYPLLFHTRVLYKTQMAAYRYSFVRCMTVCVYPVSIIIKAYRSMNMGTMGSVSSYKTSRHRATDVHEHRLGFNKEVIHYWYERMVCHDFARSPPLSIQYLSATPPGRCNSMNTLREQAIVFIEKTQNTV